MSTPTQASNRTVTLAQLRKAMTAAQTGLLAEASKARAREQEIVAKAGMETREAVKRALEGGVSARVIAAAMGLSVPRIYQMRTELERP